MKTSNEQNQLVNSRKTMKFSPSPTPFRKVAGRRYSPTLSPSPSRSRSYSPSPYSFNDGSTGGYHTTSRSPSPYFYEGPSPTNSRSLSPMSFNDGSAGGYHTYSRSQSRSPPSPSPSLWRHKRVTRRQSPSSSPSEDYSRMKNDPNVLNKRPRPDDHEDNDVQRNKRSSSQVVPCQGHEKLASPWSSVEYTNVHGLMVLKRFEQLYHKVYNRYGPIKSTRTEMNKMALEGACTNLLELINDMETRPVQELDENILRHWEVKISMLEALQLNVEWLRLCFDEVVENYKHTSKSKKKIEKKLEKTHQSINKVEEKRDKAYKELDDLMAERKEYEAKLKKVSDMISEMDEDIASLNEERAYHNEVLAEEKEKQEQDQVHHRYILSRFF